MVLMVHPVEVREFKVSSTVNGGNHWKPFWDLRQLLLVLPTELVEVADVADRLGPAPREEALDVVPVGLGQDSTSDIKLQFSMPF